MKNIFKSTILLIGLLGFNQFTSAQCSITFTVTSSSCHIDGSITANASGGTSPYTYAWWYPIAQQTTQIVTGLAPRDYSLTVTDQLGCVATSTVNVPSNTPIVTINESPPSGLLCISSATTITAAGGVGYLWLPGGQTTTTIVIAPTVAANYTVIGTDANSCTNSSAISVQSVLVSVVSKPDTCIMQDGTASAVPVLGTAPYSYLWSNNKTTQAISGIAPGNYSLTMTEANGCSATTLFNVGLFTSTVSISFTAVTPSCNVANGVLAVNPSGGTYPYSYVWSNGSSLQSISGLSPGNYSVTITDKNGCKGTGLNAVATPTFVTVPLICMVTVDTFSEFNIIIWDKTSYSHVDSFIVYREISTNNYKPVGAVPYSSLSQVTDTVRKKYFPNSGNPDAGTYRYKLQIRDSCGNYSQLSPYHNTIFVTNNNGTFSWNQLYTIEGSSNPVNSYVLMRDDNGSGNWNAINSISGTQQTITDPAYSAFQSTAYWRVETMWGISCTPSIKNQEIETYNASQSNIYTNNANAVLSLYNKLNISVYPNPFRTEAILQISDSKFTTLEWELKIYDITGRLMRDEHLSDVEETIIHRENLESGLYFLELTDKGQVVSKAKIIIGD